VLVAFVNVLCEFVHSPLETDITSEALPFSKLIFPRSLFFFFKKAQKKVPLRVEGFAIVRHFRQQREIPPPQFKVFTPFIFASETNGTNIAVPGVEDHEVRHTAFDNLCPDPGEEHEDPAYMDSYPGPFLWPRLRPPRAELDPFGGG